VIEYAARSGENHTRTGSRPGSRGAALNPILVSVLIAAGIVLGGASTPASGLAFAYQLLALVLLVVGGVVRAGPPPPLSRVVIGGAAALCALALAQVIPLPAALWTALPGRTWVSETLALAGLPAFPFAASLDPYATVVALLSLVPAAAVVTLVLRAGSIPVTRVALTVVALIALSYLIGILQFTGGSDSALYLHPFTNRGSGVGFFANANHQALLLAAGVPLVAALCAERVQRRFLMAWHAFAILALYVVAAATGITLTGSVAGMGLLLVAVLCSPWLIPSGAKTRLLVIVGGLLGAGLAALASVGVLGSTMEGTVTRPAIWRTTVQGITEFWPLGSGLGTFPSVYPLFEDGDTVTRTYVNHAHNDYLEWVFEAGLIGAALIVAGLAWWAIASVRAWRGPAEAQLWPRAASILVGLVLAHSVVDYPLRTPAMLVVTVFFALVLASPSLVQSGGAAGGDPAGRSGDRSSRRAPRHR
jgi:O-antigen ligase